MLGPEYQTLKKTPRFFQRTNKESQKMQNLFFRPSILKKKLLS